MSKRPFRFGIIGPGSIAGHHAAALAGVPGAELVAICGRDIQKTRLFAEQHGAKPFTNINDFLAHPEIDAVSIATPSGCHLESAVPAACAGKHILCEKPLEVSPERGLKLIEICEENNVQLGVYFQARFDECTLQVKEAIEKGMLGRILMASCQMRWYRSQEYYDSASWRGTWSLDGGGCLMNQGIHSVDLMINLVGDVAEVSAFQGQRTHERIEVEDNLCAVLRFENGAIGTLEASTSCAPGFPRRIEISGEKGSIVIEDNRIVRWQIEGEDLAGEQRVLNSENKESKSGGSDPMAIDVEGHRLVIEDFVTAIQQGRKPHIDGWEAKKAVDCVCAVYRSQRSGKPVRLDEG